MSNEAEPYTMAEWDQPETQPDGLPLGRGWASLHPAALYDDEDPRLRATVAALEETEAAFDEVLLGFGEALERAEKAEAFKAYVHKRLDDAGVPADPEPEQNAKHGCRIEGRLNYVFERAVLVRRRR